MTVKKPDRVINELELLSKKGRFVDNFFEEDSTT